MSTVTRALVLPWNESAHVVDPSGYQTYTWKDWSKLRPAERERFIGAVQFRLRVPELITLTDYDRLPAATVSFSRRNIFKRDHYTCQYCGKQPGIEAWTLDHVIPRAQGGVSRWGKPVQPRWNLPYAVHQQRMESWSKFVSEAYRTVELEK